MLISHNWNKFVKNSDEWQFILFMNVRIEEIETF